MGSGAFLLNVGRGTAVCIMALAGGVLVAPADADAAKKIKYVGEWESDRPDFDEFSFTVIKEGSRRTITNVSGGAVPAFCDDGSPEGFYRYGLGDTELRARVSSEGRFEDTAFWRRGGTLNQTSLAHIRGRFEDGDKLVTGRAEAVARYSNGVDCSIGFRDFYAERVRPKSAPGREAGALEPDTDIAAPAQARSSAKAPVTWHYEGRVEDNHEHTFSFDIVTRGGRRTIENVRFTGQTSVWCEDGNTYNGIASELEDAVDENGDFTADLYSRSSFLERFQFIKGSLSQRNRFAEGVYSLTSSSYTTYDGTYDCSAGLAYWTADRDPLPGGRGTPDTR